MVCGGLPVGAPVRTPAPSPSAGPPPGSPLPPARHRLPFTRRLGPSPCPQHPGTATPVPKHSKRRSFRPGRKPRGAGPGPQEAGSAARVAGPLAGPAGATPSPAPQCARGAAARGPPGSRGCAQPAHAPTGLPGPRRARGPAAPGRGPRPRGQGGPTSFPGAAFWGPARLEPRPGGSVPRPQFPMTRPAKARLSAPGAPAARFHFPSRPESGRGRAGCRSSSLPAGDSAGGPPGRGGARGRRYPPRAWGAGAAAAPPASPGPAPGGPRAPSFPCGAGAGESTRPESQRRAAGVGIGATPGGEGGNCGAGPSAGWGAVPAGRGLSEPGFRAGIALRGGARPACAEAPSTGAAPPFSAGSQGKPDPVNPPFPLPEPGKALSPARLGRCQGDPPRPAGPHLTRQHLGVCTSARGKLHAPRPPCWEAGWGPGGDPAAGGPLL